ncbi:MAG: TerB family tellurite resistance protein, partial [Glaciecola sp.]
MQLSPLQRFNEALIKLSVLLYQIDGKITLSEQDYLEDVDI